jgi:predicted TIM-barrel fold metal-dependent hydrolase
MQGPTAIDAAVDAINSAPFLSEAEKADIFYDNAARFLRLSQERSRGIIAIETIAP